MELKTKGWAGNMQNMLTKETMFLPHHYIKTSKIRLCPVMINDVFDSESWQCRSKKKPGLLRHLVVKEGVSHNLGGFGSETTTANKFEISVWIFKQRGGFLFVCLFYVTKVLSLSKNGELSDWPWWKTYNKCKSKWEISVALVNLACTK